MKSIINEDYLLNSMQAKVLYNKYSKNLPIIDYHCHLNVKDIYDNRVYEDICKLSLVDDNYGDHYKWRLMRANGISEEFISGGIDSYSKYKEWIKVLNKAVLNPVYDFSYMEFYKYFDLKEVIDEKNFNEIYEKINIKLKNLSVRKIIEMSNVEVICTTDDPLDDLKYHILLKEEKDFKTKVLPSFRPDRLLNIEDDNYNDYIKDLEKVSNKRINSFEELVIVIKERLEFFKTVGCFISDHAIDYYSFEDCSLNEVRDIFSKKINDKEIDDKEINKYKTYLLLYLASLYKDNNIVMQLHIGALRNVNEKYYKSIGKDVGNDAINDFNFSYSLSKLLNKIESNNALYKTIVYSLNPNMYDIVSTVINCFNKDVVGKMQVGSAWWFNDHIDGIEKQLTALSNTGMIANFIGMLTDSRSFLSFVRHDYFRRILCNYFGKKMLEGRLISDIESVGKIVSDISYYNALRYFGINNES